MSPQRIQRKRTKGWRMPEGAIYVGRPYRYGNPFRLVIQRDGVGDEMASVVHPDGTRSTFFYRYGEEPPRVRAAEQAVDLYRQWITNLLPFNGTRDAIQFRLGGHDLACWCPLDQPCHADVLLEIANGDQP